MDDDEGLSLIYFLDFFKLHLNNKKRFFFLVFLFHMYFLEKYFPSFYFFSFFFFFFFGLFLYNTSPPLDCIQFSLFTDFCFSFYLFINLNFLYSSFLDFNSYFCFFFLIIFISIKIIFLYSCVFV